MIHKWIHQNAYILVGNNFTGNIWSFKLMFLILMCNSMFMSLFVVLMFQNYSSSWLVNFVFSCDQHTCMYLEKHIVKAETKYCCGSSYLTNPIFLLQAWNIIWYFLSFGFVTCLKMVSHIFQILAIYNWPSS